MLVISSYEYHVTTVYKCSLNMQIPYVHMQYCMILFLIGFCEQSINSTDYIVTYNTIPSYTQSTATLRCIKGYAAIEPGLAICGSDGKWIIKYPECEGTYSYIMHI